MLGIGINRKVTHHHGYSTAKQHFFWKHISMDNTVINGRFPFATPLPLLLSPLTLPPTPYVRPTAPALFPCSHPSAATPCPEHCPFPLNLLYAPVPFQILLILPLPLPLPLPPASVAYPLLMPLSLPLSLLLPLNSNPCLFSFPLPSSLCPLPLPSDSFPLTLSPGS